MPKRQEKPNSKTIKIKSKLKNINTLSNEINLSLVAQQNPVFKMSHSYHCNNPVVAAAVREADSEGEEEEEEEMKLLMRMMTMMIKSCNDNYEQIN